METFHYTCLYCGKTYKPSRRKKQKYCSNSCRTRAFQLRNIKLVKSPVPSVDKKEPFKIDKVSFAGVANAAAGTFAVNTLTNLFTSDGNKPATKKDIEMVLRALSKDRYKLIDGVMPKPNGLRAYFDSFTNRLVHLLPNINPSNQK